MLSRLVSDREAVAPITWDGKGRVRSSAKSPRDPSGRSDSGDDAADTEERLRQAYDAGIAEGRAAAAQAAEEALRSVVERLAATTADIAATRGEALRRAEADMVRLSIEIARRILHRELSADTSVLEPLIRAALEKLQSQEVYRVRVHPDLEQLVRACLQQIGRNSEIEVISDVTQPRGGAVFEINRGSLDASVETQLREIERGMADHLGGRG